MESTASAGRDLSKYQGKNLGFLLLAMGLPAALLYLRIVLGTVVGYSRGITPVQSGRLTLLSNLALACFFLVQFCCALYILRLVPARRSTMARIGQFAAVLLLCILLSYTGAVLFEAFGMAVLVRTGHY